MPVIRLGVWPAMARVGFELMACASREPPSGRFAGVRDGVEALAFGITETTGAVSAADKRRRLRPTPFHYLLRLAYNPRSALPAARTKNPTNRSVNPVVI